MEVQMNFGLAKSLDELAFSSGISDIVPAIHSAVTYIQNLITPRAIPKAKRYHDFTSRQQMEHVQDLKSQIESEEEYILTEYLLKQMMLISTHLSDFTSIKIATLTPSIVVFIFELKDLGDDEPTSEHTSRERSTPHDIHTDFKYRH